MVVDHPINCKVSQSIFYRAIYLYNCLDHELKMYISNNSSLRKHSFELFLSNFKLNNVEFLLVRKIVAGSNAFVIASLSNEALLVVRSSAVSWSTDRATIKAYLPGQNVGVLFRKLTMHPSTHDSPAQALAAFRHL